jgi:hypothetical protein
MKYRDLETVRTNMVITEFLKKEFHKKVHLLGYVGGIDHMQYNYTTLWGSFGEDVMQWYDFEIIGVSHD